MKPKLIHAYTVLTCAYLLVIATAAHVAVFDIVEDAMSFGSTGHNTITCDDDGEVIKMQKLSGGVTEDQYVTDITLSNPSATIVRIYSGNGQAISKGTPLCTSGSCVGVSIRLAAGGGLWKCATDSGTQAVYVLGGA